MSEPINDDVLNKEIEGDRGIPSVKQNSDYTKILAVIFLLFGTIAIIFVIMDGLKENKPKKLTEPQENTFQTYSGNSGPYISDPVIPPPDNQLSENLPETNTTQNTSQLEILMQQEALRIAKEKQVEAKKRIQSPQLIFDEGKAASAQTQNAIAHENAGSLSSSNDPNLEFASHFNNKDVEKVTASQLNNLSTLITQGTMIDGILETAIQSDLPGMVRAIVSENIYSFSGNNLLVPKGSKLVGQYNSGLVRGQSRVFIIWNRLITPEGVSIQIGSYGADNLGRSGVAGEVDTHFFERFGSSILLSMINASIEIGVNSLDNQDATNIAVDSGSEFSRSAEIALENSIRIKPTVNIHQGTQIKVFVGKDLDFEQVANSND